jgi:DNA-binding transcriptional ArsR family regulator
MEMSSAIPCLSALAHEGRLLAFRLLVKAGPQGVPAGELAKRLDMAPNTLSGCLNVLTGAGLVEHRRVGRSVIHKARFEEVTALLRFLMEDCCAGTSEICSPLAELALACGDRAEREKMKDD